MAFRAYIVEDSPTIRDNLIETLQELAEVEPVGTAETESEGKQWLAANDGYWDLAIVDLFLKQGSGLGVLEACQQRASGQRVVVLSNYATTDMRKRCLQLGADAERKVLDVANAMDRVVAPVKVIVADEEQIGRAHV